MKKQRIYIGLVLTVLSCLCGCGQEKSAAQIVDLTVNNKTKPIGIDENPYFSWKMKDSVQGQKQTAYQIVVSDSEKKLQKKQYVWDSGRIESDISVAIAYAGNALQPEEDYFWQVKVWDKEDAVSVSEISSFEMGMMGTEWTDAQWIMCEKEKNTEDEYSTTQYQITYEFKMEKAATGFLWGGDEGRYGSYYLWEFDASHDNVIFSMSHMHDEVVLETKSIELEGWESQAFKEASHQVRIIVDKQNIKTYLDEILISETEEFGLISVASIGLWVERSESKAWYDNICVTDLDGTVLYQDTFETENTHMFQPYYAKIENGWVRADSGFLVVPGYEVPAPLFRKTFQVDEKKQVEKARLYASALGIYDLYINGKDICPEYAAPGQSYYYEEVYYRTYDITDELTKGSNAIGVILGHGRYDRAKEAWGEDIAICAQLVITYTDGTQQIVSTDESWLTYANGPIRSDDIYCGEYYDANYEVEDWAGINCDESKWKSAKLCLSADELTKKAAKDAGVVCVNKLNPVSIQQPVEGITVIDFGQNFNGVCSIQLNGKKGQTVMMRYAEYLNAENLNDADDVSGTVWTRNLCTADNTDYYTFAADEEVVYTPTLTYRGFRYVQISGLDDVPEIDDVQGLVLSTDNKRTGYFECSDQKMNRLYESIYWTQLSNYVDIPTDCPQRDERFGWTGDAQVFAYTGSLNANTANFMYEYIDALRAGQSEDGAYLQVVPDWKTSGGANGWSDAGIILVWEMYQQYGNKRVIYDNLDAMCHYADYLVETSEQFLREHVAYNDHNALSYMDDTNCNTAQCAYAIGLLSKMCDVIGEKELAVQYKKIQEQYINAWQENYLGENGAIGSWLQSEYVLALAYELYPTGMEAMGAEKLRISIETNDDHVTTGYITTPHLLKTLCDYGYADTAYRMVQKEGYPSWNEMLANGSTTMTERWDSIVKNADGTITINGSLNHLGLGSMGEWFYTEVLGITRDEAHVAYKHFYLEPHVGGNLSYAKGSYESMYGTIVSEWEVIDGNVNYHFEIPANTTATLTIPNSEYQGVELEAGSYDFTVSFGNN